MEFDSRVQKEETQMISITITGEPGSGKSTAAFLIKAALKALGANVSYVDDDSLENDGGAYEKMLLKMSKESLKGKSVTIRTQQIRHAIPASGFSR